MKRKCIERMQWQRFHVLDLYISISKLRALNKLAITTRNICILLHDMSFFIFFVEKVDFKSCFQIHAFDLCCIYLINMLAFQTNDFNHCSVRHAFNQFSSFVLFTIRVSKDDIVCKCASLLHITLCYVNILYIINVCVINESFSYCDAVW